MKDRTTCKPELNIELIPKQYPMFITKGVYSELCQFIYSDTKKPIRIGDEVRWVYKIIDEPDGDYDRQLIFINWGDVKHKYEDDDITTPDMKKYVAFGIGYQDNKGTIIEESESYYIVEAEGYGIHPIAITKDEPLTKVFDTEDERDTWIKDQHYQYDPR